MSYVHNSVMRTCDWPHCPAAYDAVTGPGGQTAERHWRSLKTYGLHLCPDHSPVCGSGDGPHAPHLDHKTATSACNCGHPLPGPTLGDMADAYVAHLAALASHA